MTFAWKLILFLTFKLDKLKIYILKESGSATKLPDSIFDLFGKDDEWFDASLYWFDWDKER